MSSCFCLASPIHLLRLWACLLSAYELQYGAVAWRRRVLALYRDAAHGHEPRVARGILGLVRRERELAHLDVRPGRVVVAPAREVAEEVPVRDERDVRLGPLPQPAPDPPRAGLQGVLG